MSGKGKKKKNLSKRRRKRLKKKLRQFKKNKYDSNNRHGKRATQ